MSFLTLRVRTFLLMLLTIVVAFLLTGTFSLYHFRLENRNYHFERLERKEKAILSHIDYFTRSDQNKGLLANQWERILSGKVAEISSIHKLDFGIYTSSGVFVAGSFLRNEDRTLFPMLLTEYANSAKSKGRKVTNEGNFLVSTSEVIGSNNRVELVVRIPYEIDPSAIPKEDVAFLRQLLLLYILLFAIGITFAVFFSNYISKNMRLVIDQLKKVRINKSNEKLTWRLNDEIGELIQEYNVLVDKLETTAIELARSERESAWKEMAQQVAHEITNPLTPMKLTLQMMQRETEVSEMKSMAAYLLDEVASLTNIAEAFSRFAQMPGLKAESLDISYQTNRAVSLYIDRGVTFLSTGPVYTKVDKDQWSRIIHNLVKNAFQSIPEGTEAVVDISIEKELNKAIVIIRDNGTGIPLEMQDRVFEPNFTTKSSGMGLGLAMVKNLIGNFGGTINFSTGDHGTAFRIELPITSIK